MEHWLNNIHTGKPVSVPLVHYKSHTNWPRIEPGPPGREAGV